MGVLQRLLLALAAQIPVVSVAVVWWTEVLKNPIIAVIIAVMYEGVVLAWGILVKDIWGVLKPGVVNASADWVKVMVLNAFSRFRRHYNRQIIYEHRVFNVRGLRTKGSYVELEQVFVELNIAHSNLQQISTNPLLFKNISESQPIWQFLRQFKKKEAVALAILGPPGCGKTTLMQHLALTFAANRQRRYRLRAYIPMLLFLREHATAIVEKSLSLPDLAQQHFSDQTRYPELKPPPQWFLRQLRKGECLVLLDGLDEVVEASQRQKIAKWVDQQIRNYPRCHFILTARPQGYQSASLSQAHVFEVMSFGPQKVKQFIRNWYLANKLIAAGKDDRGVQQDANREAEDLLHRLQDTPRLEDLTVNPLLLTMIANVHNFRGELPEERIELYDEICNVLLGYWQQAKGKKVKEGDPKDLTFKQKRVILQPLAEAMMNQKVSEIATQEAQKIIMPYLNQVDATQEHIDNFLKNIQQTTNGLLIEKETGVWSFAHLTFQEYLCATHWRDTGKVSAWDGLQWQQFIEDGWWHETVRLYAAQSDAKILVEACLQLNSELSLELAANIAEEALQLEASLREKTAKTREERSVIRLRSQPIVVTDKEAQEKFKIDMNRQPLEYIQNNYEVEGEMVADHATGLMWQKVGSTTELSYEQVQEYVQQLNREQFVGYSDWRLPTISELMSLFESKKQSNDLFIHPIFDSNQRFCWSSDRLPDGEIDSWESVAAWNVYFTEGSVYWDSLSGKHYGRCVRSCN